MNKTIFLRTFIYTIISGSFLLLLALKIFSFDKVTYGEKEVGKVESFDPSSMDKSVYKTPCFDIPERYNTDLGDVQKIIGYQNNKFGLYIFSELGYVELAGDLVNSKGGDWGYVLIPYNVKDYDSGKWKKVFRKLGEKHLIPIIQLWDLSKEDENEQIVQSAHFLNSLDWPIKNRYVSVYNEVNDSRFWRGRADPVAYAEILDKTIKVFKNLNENFFMLNGAFNASARSGNGYIDEREFLIKMNNAVEGIFTKLDGWASHPYPQPEFSGSPFDSGRNSIRAYEWELNLLKNLFGVDNIPVFITETGWAHAEGASYDGRYFPEEIASEYIVRAFKNVWLPDPRVVAVTPFVIAYNSPNDHFSWIDENEKPYDRFKKIQKIEKTEGKPPYVLEKGKKCGN